MIDQKTAQDLLESSLYRLVRGGQRVAAMTVLFFGIGQVFVALRYLNIAHAGGKKGILLEFGFDLLGLVVLLLIIWSMLPIVLRFIYRPLLEQGKLIRVAPLNSPHSIHQRFTGQSTQPFMIRGALEGFEKLVGNWIPTKAVNFRPIEESREQFTGFLFSDEILPDQDNMQALLVRGKKLHSWLVRYPSESRP